MQGIKYISIIVHLEVAISLEVDSILYALISSDAQRDTGNQIMSSERAKSIKMRKQHHNMGFYRSWPDLRVQDSEQDETEMVSEVFISCFAAFPQTVASTEAHT